jgi:hypothetical protein
MNEYLSQVNTGMFYLIVALVLAFITVMCFVFLIKSYRAGIKLGMDKRLCARPSLPAPHSPSCPPSASCWVSSP